MAGWYKCQYCSTIFYTDEPLYDIESTKKCEKCHGSLHSVHPEPRKLLEEGLEINLVLSNWHNIESDKVVSLKGKVIEVGESEFKIIPEDKEVLSRIKKGTEYLVRFRKQGILAGLFSFETEVLDFDWQGNAMTLLLPDIALLHQEREEPRFDLNLNVELFLLKEGEYLEAYSEDISVKGIALKVPASEVKNKLSINDRMLIKLEMEDNDLELEGKLVRIDTENYEEVLVGVRFEDIGKQKKEILKRVQAFQLAHR